MDSRKIIEEIAGQADEFLAGAANRKEARAGIGERLAVEFPGLDPAERDQITRKVMAILDTEEFFDSASSDGAVWDDAGAAPPEGI